MKIKFYDGGGERSGSTTSNNALKFYDMCIQMQY